MADGQRAPEAAPRYAKHRTVEDAADGLPVTLTTKGHGLNCQGRRFVNFQVVPTPAAANPSVEVLFWSEAAGHFISANTPIAKAGIGAGLPYEFTVEAHGRILFCRVTAGIAASQVVEIYASSAELSGL